MQAWTAVDRPSPAAEVRAAGAVPPRDAPGGRARIWPLAQGTRAFVGRLELEPKAVVPPHRDEAEETIVVLQGHGRVTIDGEETPVGPGAAIFMPAGAEVSFRQRL